MPYRPANWPGGRSGGGSGAFRGFRSRGRERLLVVVLLVHAGDEALKADGLL
ncbi:MAG: hypothetical protein ACLSAF_04785 [Intestinimonas sp.]